MAPSSKKDKNKPPLGSISDTEELFDAVFQTVIDAIVIIDEHGIIEAVNPAVEVLFGYSPSELMGKNVSVLMPSPYKEEHDTYLFKYLDTGIAKIIGYGRELEALRKDGTVFPIDLAVTELNHKGRKLFTGIVRDLTEYKSLQEALSQKQALAHLGEMASVIAHEVRNPLAGISGALQNLDRALTGNDPKKEIITEILERVGSLNDTLSDLLYFARLRPPQPVPLDIENLLEEVHAFFRGDPASADVEVMMRTEPATVQGDRDQLRAALLNLLLNATQAMDGRGTITVEVRIDKEACVIEIRDDGPGIPEKVRETLFDPFVTTKTAGTGLGLSVVRRIVEAHGGTISLGDTKGKGATFRIHLPLSPTDNP